MVFLRRSPHRVSEQGQKSSAKLYSSGTRSRNRRRALWHFWRLQLLSVTVARLVQATTYSDRREPHFSYRPQSWAAFRHWFWPSTEREDAGDHQEESSVKKKIVKESDLGALSLNIKNEWEQYLPWWRPYVTSQCFSPDSPAVLHMETLHTHHMLKQQWRGLSHGLCSWESKKAPLPAPPHTHAHNQTHRCQ